LHFLQRSAADQIARAGPHTAAQDQHGMEQAQPPSGDHPGTGRSGSTCFLPWRRQGQKFLAFKPKFLRPGNTSLSYNRHRAIHNKEEEQAMIGFRIYELSQRVSPEWVEKFRDLPVANVSDCMWRMTAGGAALRPMHAGGVLAGPAFTVKTRPGDNLMVHKAIAMAQPGDVIVVDAGGEITNAIIGELMVATAKRKGLAGFIIHGAIRDSAELG